MDNTDALTAVAEAIKQQNQLLKEIRELLKTLPDRRAIKEMIHDQAQETVRQIVSSSGQQGQPQQAVRSSALEKFRQGLGLHD